MSASNKPARGVVKTILLSLTAAILLIAGVFALPVYRGRENAETMKQEIYRVAAVANIDYKDVVCIYNNIDTPDYCTFKIEGNPSNLDAINKLTSALRKEGYSISNEPSRYEADSNIVEAKNTSLDMQFNYVTYIANNPQELTVNVSRTSKPY